MQVFLIKSGVSKTSKNIFTARGYGIQISRCGFSTLRGKKSTKIPLFKHLINRCNKLFFKNLKIYCM